MGKKLAVADVFRRRGRLMSRLMLQGSTHESSSVAKTRDLVSGFSWPKYAEVDS